MYVTARNTSGSGTFTSFPESILTTASNIGVPTGTAQPFTISGTFATESNTNGSSVSWIANVNYVLTTVTLTSDNPSLTIVTEGNPAAGSAEGRGLYQLD